jgi:hypothetical protein
VENGRSVISMGPLFYFTVGENSIGDEIIAGENSFEFTLDFSRMKKMGVKEKVTPKEIRFISNGGETVAVIESTCASTTLNLKEKSWYNAELWGSIDEKENCLIALTAPIYTKGETI